MSYQFWSEPRKDDRHSPIWMWLSAMGFIVCTIVSYQFSYTANYGFDELIRTFSFIMIFLWSGRFMVSESGKYANTYTMMIVKSVTYFTILACIIGCAVYVFQPVERFVGSFFDYRFHTDYWPNAWAEFVVLTWPIVYIWTKRIEVFRNSESILPRIIQILVLGFIIGCLLLSYSRGAMIACAGQLVLWAIFEWRCISANRKRVAVNLISVILVSVLMFWGFNAARAKYFAIESVGEKVTFTAAEGTSSVSERGMFWWQSIALAVQNPVWGWGPYSFRFVQPQYQTGVLETSDHSHNVFLKIAAERGFITMGVYMLVIFGVLYVVTQQIINNTCERIHRETCILFVVAICGVIAHNLIDYNLQFVGISLLFWIILGMLSSAIYTKKKLSFPRKIMRVVEIILVTLFLIAGAVEARFLLLSSFGRHAEEAGRTQEALEWYESAKKQRFSRDMHLSRAQLYREEGNIEEAESALQDYFAANALDARAWRLWGEICMQKKDWACAEEKFEEAYRMNSYNDIGIVRGLVESFLMQGKQDAVDLRREEFEELMSEYLEAIERNAHFIALSHNAIEMIELSQIFADLYPDDEPQYIVMGARVARKAKQEHERYEARPPGYLW